MDYSLFTSEIIDERYESVPATLRAVFESEQTKRILAGISREHYLDPDKSLILEQLVELALLGFIPLRALPREVSEQMFINFEHARVLADELYNRIFAPYEEELAEAYKPIEEVLAEKEKINEAIERKSTEENIEEGAIEKQEETIKPSFFMKEEKTTPIKIETSEEAPLILHEEPTFFSVAQKDNEKRPETPFNKFIPSSSESAEKKLPRAKIESGSINPFSFLKPEEKTTIHYSEIRSELKPEIGREEEVISVGALERMREPELETKQIETPKIEIKNPEIITITPKTAQTPDQTLINAGATPEIPKKQSSWISNIFKSTKQDEKKTNISIPEIHLQEQKPEGEPQIIQGNIINLK